VYHSLLEGAKRGLDADGFPGWFWVRSSDARRGLGPAHIHRGDPSADPEEYPEVEFDEVVEEIRDYLGDGSLP
jgi:hypothetical protein